MNEKDVAKGIADFIEKYITNPEMLKLPQWNFRIKGISNVEIDKASLKEYKERWTFEGTADIEKTDENGIAPIIDNCKIVGSAVIETYKNLVDDYLLPDVKHVTITKIKL